MLVGGPLSCIEQMEQTTVMLTRRRRANNTHNNDISSQKQRPTSGLVIKQKNASTSSSLQTKSSVYDGWSISSERETYRNRKIALEFYRTNSIQCFTAYSLTPSQGIFNKALLAWVTYQSLLKVCPQSGSCKDVNSPKWIIWQFNNTS